MCCCICIRSVLLLLPALKLGSQSLCSRSSLSLKCSNHIVMKRGSTQHSQPEMFKSYSYEKWFHSAQSYTVPEHTSDHDQYAHAYTHTHMHIYSHIHTYTRTVWIVSSHFEYLENQKRGLDVTWQPNRGHLTVRP